MSWEADSKSETCRQKVYPEVCSETIPGGNGGGVGGMRDSELGGGKSGACKTPRKFSGSR